MVKKVKTETEVAKEAVKAEEFGAGLAVTGEENDGQEIGAGEAALPPDAEFSAELSENEKAEIEAEARREVQEALKAAKKKDYKAQLKKRIKSEAMFRSGKDDKGNDLDTIDLVLASYPQYIILDGAVYHSGKRYTKNRNVIAVLKDQMDRGWRQEAARMGEKTDWVAQKQKLLTRGGLQIH